jgi:hypothetical protein
VAKRAVKLALQLDQRALHSPTDTALIMAALSTILKKLFT